MTTPKIDALTASVDAMKQELVELKQTLTSTSNYSSLAEKIETLSQALTDRAALGQDHKHGMADPECPGCNTVVQESLDAAQLKIVTFYDGIPGVKHLREIWEEQQKVREQLKAEGKGPEKELITFTG